MTESVLIAKERTLRGSHVKALRREGILPAVVYGAGIDSTAIELDRHVASKVLSTVGGSTLVTLNIGNEKHQVLVREIQRDPIRLDILHVDFLKVAMDVKIRTMVPVELLGEAPAVQEVGGLLVTGLSEVEVEALPSDLPEKVTVDIGSLVSMDDSITVADLVFGESVELLTSPDELIASVVYQVEEEIEEEEVEEIFEEEGEPEVIEKGKREEEEEGYED
jgi:large subunit ribosomal protein L25